MSTYTAQPDHPNASAPDAAEDPEKARMLRGELYHAFTPALTAERNRCARACHDFNAHAANSDRLTRVNLFRALNLPPLSPASDTTHEPWIEPPLHIDYGTNLSLSPGVFINFNFTALDTCRVSIGARTLIGPNVSLYSGTHPLSASLRNGTAGPELGQEISIGEDCWLGGGVTVLPGVRIGDRVVVGAGTVVVRDTGDDVVVVGNPGRVVRRLLEDGVGRVMTEKVGVEEERAKEVVRLRRRVEELERVVGELKAVVEGKGE
ncbi:trimeric LpxA-like protein [Ascodesmis nigricans]|uniref:Trimeric LpxA-like protein n=1 Tax=Ascodesmis nigricans TaxID=341454 RepID=A0A4S2MIP8_9PEZI|nr:trimeric LpxA-like protein [Ascodesmis nigricans]